MVQCWYGSGPLVFSLCVPSSGVRNHGPCTLIENAEHLARIQQCITFLKREVLGNLLVKNNYNIFRAWPTASSSRKMCNYSKINFLRTRTSFSSHKSDVVFCPQSSTSPPSSPPLHPHHLPLHLPLPTLTFSVHIQS